MMFTQERWVGVSNCLVCQEPTRIFFWSPVKIRRTHLA
jgi:hypothetical protein